MIGTFLILAFASYLSEDNSNDIAGLDSEQKEVKLIIKGYSYDDIKLYNFRPTDTSSYISEKHNVIEFTCPFQNKYKLSIVGQKFSFTPSKTFTYIYFLNFKEEPVLIQKDERLQYTYE